MELFQYRKAANIDRVKVADGEGFDGVTFRFDCLEEGLAGGQFPEKNGH
ncbi:hypothetical protein NITLEN_30094 [Nitrospira lenta]|uniref:Uncharacterized protein n=1 Tax=Nitrospira lenta TaxID=1436998 RepID=A0A330LE11_9BACT|nr:hypothetical protein NITLEN_30094 [Nitrospira lenta]